MFQKDQAKKDLMMKKLVEDMYHIYLFSLSKLEQLLVFLA